MDANTSKQFLSPHEYGRLAGLSIATVRRYLKGGRLPFAQPGGPRGRILIPLAAVTLTVSDPAPSALRGGRAESSTQTVPLPGPTPRWLRSHAS